MERTIAAIATPFGTGGLSVIRISGSDARKISSKVFKEHGKRQISTVKGFSAILGKVYDDSGVFDDAVATVFIAPKSYTGEDVVELSCHGGTYVISRLLRACYNAGAKPAEAGEFTKRAFLNGKMSLNEAEAVIDIINAKNQLSATAAFSAKEGALNKRLDKIIAVLTHQGAHLAAWIDYPEEDLEEVEEEKLLLEIREIYRDLISLLSTYDQGRIIREGISTAIIGKPNVGKSTLMNCLTGCQTSIVTHIAGTTRDVVEETVVLGDVVLRLSDTAGIRDTQDFVESIGVENSIKKITGSNLILAVFDGGEELTQEDIQILNLIKNHPCVAVINKTDLDNKLDNKYISDRISHTVYISAVNSQGLDDLSSAIKEIYMLNKLDSSGGIIYTERQRLCVDNAVSASIECIEALEIGTTLDAITVCIEDILQPLLELTGKTAAQQVVDGVFSQFCVGK